MGLNAEKSGHVGCIMIVAMTYGPRPSSQELKDEILEVGGKIYIDGMSLLLIDTENKFVSTGFTKEIARVAQESINYCLPNASDAVVSGTTKDMLSALMNS